MVPVDVEGQKTPHHVEVAPKLVLIAQLPDVDIEDVDDEGTLDNVEEGKAKGPEWNTEMKTIFVFNRRWCFCDSSNSLDSELAIDSVSIAFLITS